MTMAIGDSGVRNQLLDRFRIGVPVLDRTGQQVDRSPSPRSRYAALTDIASVDDDEVHLSLAAADLPQT